MIWNHTDTSELKMKNFSEEEFYEYLSKIKTETLLAYGVYQVEADGLNYLSILKVIVIQLWVYPIKDIINYIGQYKK